MLFKRDHSADKHKLITGYISELVKSVELMQKTLDLLNRYLSNRKQCDGVKFSPMFGHEENPTKEFKENKKLIQELEKIFGNNLFYSAPEVVTSVYVNGYQAGINANKERIALLETVKTGGKISADELDFLKLVPALALIDTELHIKISNQSNSACSSLSS